jgi:hypothetical protein
MSLTPGGLTGSAAAHVPTRQRRLEALTLLLTGCAVAASTGWGPFIFAAARDLRPQQLDHVAQYTNTQLQAAVEPARLHLWGIVLVSFAVIVALVGMAILVGRRALHQTEGADALARLGTWALWCLVGGVGMGVGLLVIALSPVGKSFSLPTDMSVLLLSLILAGAVGSVILAALALGRPVWAAVNIGMAPRAWRGRVRLCLVGATLMALSAFALLAFAAQFTLGFYLRFVF